MKMRVWYNSKNGKVVPEAKSSEFQACNINVRKCKHYVVYFSMVFHILVNETGEYQMNLGERIIEQREKKNMNQFDLAEKLDVSRQTISRWESNIVAPNADNLRELSVLFGVSVDYLLNGEEFTPPKYDTDEQKLSWELKQKEEIVDTLKKKLIREEWIFGGIIGALSLALMATIIVGTIKNQPEKPTPMEDLSTIIDADDTMPEIIVTFAAIE